VDCVTPWVAVISALADQQYPPGEPGALDDRRGRHNAFQFFHLHLTSPPFRNEFYEPVRKRGRLTAAELLKPPVCVVLLAPSEDRKADRKAETNAACDTSGQIR
jgi:hypothetical protein